MKFGFDLHGVLCENQALRVVARLLKNEGHEVHIITGARFQVVQPELEKYAIAYTHFFSITEHHEKIGTPMEYDEKRNPFMDDYLWDKTKGDYCREHGIDLHFDDSDKYDYFFSTPYARFFTKDKRKVYKK
jgi:hypothetical protein